MSDYNTKNYSEQGGGKLVIGGELVIEEGATVTGLNADGTPLGAATEAALGGVKAAAKAASDTVEVKIGEDEKLYVPEYPAPQPAYTLPAAGSDLGGVKAAAKGVGDTVEVKIGTDEKLYVPAYPTVTAPPVAVNQPASEAEDVGELVADFNALLEKLKAAGIVAAD